MQNGTSLSMESVGEAKRLGVPEGACSLAATGLQPPLRRGAERTTMELKDLRGVFYVSSAEWLLKFQLTKEKALCPVILYL